MQPSPEPLIDRADVKAQLLALLDIQLEAARIRDLLEEGDVGGETEED